MNSRSPVRIALGQLSGTRDKAANIDAVTTLARKAGAEAADLLVLPEQAMYLAGFTEPVDEVAEGLDGPFVSVLTALAAEHELTIVAGMYERAANEAGALYNTLVVVGPAGLLESYRKLHLCDAFGLREPAQVSPGQGQGLTFDFGGTRIGLLNCYDIRFPELALLLTAAGAELLVASAAWAQGSSKESHWETLLRARAIENGCWVAAAGQATDAQVGNSMLIDPSGVVVSSLGEQRNALCAGDVYPDRATAVRRALPALTQRPYVIS
jgi:predicted amidohydrolase